MIIPLWRRSRTIPLLLCATVVACAGRRSLDLSVQVARYDTTANPHEAWELKTELHSRYSLFLSTRRDTLAALVRLDSAVAVTTTPSGTQATPARGSGGGAPVLSYTFTKAGAGALKVDSIPTSASPRGLNESQLLEAPNLFLRLPTGACRAGRAWVDSVSVDGVPIHGSTQSEVRWAGRFQVDSLTAGGVWISGTIQLHGRGDGVQTGLRDLREVTWLLSAGCRQPIRYADRRHRVLVLDDPDTGAPHDSVVSRGVGTATFRRAR